MQNCIGLQHNMQFLSSRPHYDNRDTFLHAAYCRLEGVTRERVDIELEVGLRMHAETDLGGARWSPPTESLRDKQKPWVINSVTVDETETSRPEADGDDKGHVSDHGSASDAGQARPREVVSPPGNLTCKRLLSTIPKAQNLPYFF